MTKNYIFIFINIRADDSKNFTVYIIFQKNEKLLETVFSKIKKKKSKKKKRSKKNWRKTREMHLSLPLTFSPIASLLFRRKKNGATFDNYIAGSQPRNTGRAQFINSPTFRMKEFLRRWWTSVRLRGEGGGGERKGYDIQSFDIGDRRPWRHAIDLEMGRSKIGRA